MYSNQNEFIKTQINQILETKLENLPQNVPVEIINIDTSKMLLDLKSMVDDREFKGVPFIGWEGLQINSENLKFGLFVSCPFYFYEILSDGKISATLSSSQTNYGLFIPILNNESKYQDNSDNGITLYDANNEKQITINQEGIGITNSSNNQISLSDDGILLENTNTKESIELNAGVTINSGANTIQIQNQSQNLKDLLLSLVDIINASSTGTGNQGAPIIPNPTLQPLLQKFQASLNLLLG